MAPRITFINQILAGRIDWKIVVRIIRLWHVSDFRSPEITSSIEMIFVDERVRSTMQYC